MASRSIPPIDPRSALVRVAIAFGGGLAAFGVALLGMRPTGAAFIAWDAFGLVLLLLSWALIGRCDARATRHRAGAEDPGRTLVYVMVVLASSVSLLGATLLVRNPHTLSPELEHYAAALCLLTVALAWTMTHTAFTFRYAHLYYREDAEGVGGLEVPGGKPPTYFDFAYFAFTIGMCFQVSDVTVTSHQIRRTVLLHAVISFAYNSIVLAFVLNLVFSAG
jgi:uncharacterized membrane protein